MRASQREQIHFSIRTGAVVGMFKVSVERERRNIEVFRSEGDPLEASSAHNGQPNRDLFILLRNGRNTET